MLVEKLHELWILNDRPHRRGDRPAKIHTDGTTEILVEGLYHSLKKPATSEGNGAQWWYNKGKLDRSDGPAVIWGSGIVEYYNGGAPKR